MQPQGATVVVAVLGVGGLAAVSMQVRCVDAAREAARLAARGWRIERAPPAATISRTLAAW